MLNGLMPLCTRERCIHMQVQCGNHLVDLNTIHCRIYIFQRYERIHSTFATEFAFVYSAIFYWIENSQNWKKKTQNIRAIQPKSSYFVNVPSINFQLILLTYLQFSQSKSIIVARCLKPRTQHFVWEWNEILCFFFLI